MRSHFRFILIVLSLAFFSPTVGSEVVSPSVHFERLGPFGGDVRALLVDAQDPGVAYAGTSSGKMFKSVNSGKSWMPLYPGIGRNAYVVDTLVHHPSESGHLYAGAWDLHSEGGGLYESRDAGITWTQIVLPQRSAAIRGFGICRADPSYMIAGTLAGVFVSPDRGRTWKQVGGSELQKAESVAIDPADYHNLYVGTWRLGYRSHDFGKTWTRIDKGMPLDSDVFSLTIHPTDPRIVYASACSGVYRSINGARSWTRLKILPDRFTIRAHIVLIDPVNAHRIYTGTTEGLFVSSNGGQTWKCLTPGNVIVNSIQVDPGNNQRILIGTEYQGILLSEDGGQSWRESNAGFVHHQISWIISDPQGGGQLLSGVVSGAGGLYSYDHRARDWKRCQTEPGVRVLAFLILPNDRGRLAGTAQGVYWQPSRSGTWRKLSGSISRRTIYSLELDASASVVYAGTDQGIYRTSLSALDFRLPPACRFSPKVWCVLSPKSIPGVVYAGTSLGLLRSWDRGTTWNVISAFGLPQRATINIMVVSPAEKDRLFAGTSVGLFESENGGIHWRRTGADEINGDVSSVIFLDDYGMRILAADKTWGGIFHSPDGGDKWVKLSSPEYESPVNCLLRDPEQSSLIYVGTQIDGVYLLDLRYKKYDIGQQ